MKIKKIKKRLKDSSEQLERLLLLKEDNLLAYSLEEYLNSQDIKKDIKAINQAITILEDYEQEIHSNLSKKDKNLIEENLKMNVPYYRN